MKGIPVTLIMFLMFSCSGEVQRDAVSAEIRAVMDAQVVAWNAEDIDGFMDGYLNSPDLVFAGAGKFRYGWETVLSRYKENYPAGSMGTLSFDDLAIHPTSRDAAWVIGKWSVVLDEENPHGAFTLVFRRTEEGWKIIHDHTSSFKDPGEKEEH